MDGYVRRGGAVHALDLSPEGYEEATTAPWSPWARKNAHESWISIRVWPTGRSSVWLIMVRTDGHWAKETSMTRWLPR